MTAETSSKGIRVVLWHGTTQETHHATTYGQSLQLVDARHANAHDPAFYDEETGERLYDSGNGLCSEDGRQVF